ncbi:hypothetical protein [Nocardia transvalensis]|uniref:hypothetical protein n=1 Tax=Nocardia transvalensis TaxID=37333 RepID=UPI001E306066|nr:hypothetical protein [Nocardia transvalensis]
MTFALLAQSTTNPTGPEFGKASPLGLVIILVLLAGTVLLIRSMNKHIKGLPAEFSPEHPEPDQEADEGTEPGITHRDEETPEDSSDEKPTKPSASAKPDSPA